MPLEIKNGEIIGEIDDLKEKLNGEIPINRLELLYLVNSWEEQVFLCTKF